MNLKFGIENLLSERVNIGKVMLAVCLWVEDMTRSLTKAGVDVEEYLRKLPPAMF